MKPSKEIIKSETNEAVEYADEVVSALSNLNDRQRQIFMDLVAGKYCVMCGAKGEFPCHECGKNFDGG